MATETIILDFQVNQGDAITELEKTKKSIIELKKEQQELNKAYKAGNITLDEYASESVRLEGVLKKASSQYNTLQKSAAGVETQFDKLIKANQNLVKTNQKISDNLSDMGEGFKNFAGQVNVGGVSLGDLTGKLSSFINPATAAAGAVSALAGLYLSSAAGARDLESAQIQLSQSFTTMSNDLAELLGADGKGGGLLSSLAEQFNRIVFGLSASVRGNLAAGAQNALKEIELAEINAKAVAKRALDEAEKLRRIRDDDTKSFGERKKAAEDALGFINVREQALANVQRDKISQLKILLSLNKDDLELQKQVRLAELELADVLEDSQGKRTETLNGINVLKKETIGLTNAEIVKLNELSNAALQAELSQVKAEQEKQKAYQDTINELNNIISKTDEYHQLIDLSSALAEQEKSDKEEQTKNEADYQRQIDSSNKAKQKEILMNEARVDSLGTLSQAFISIASQTKDLASAGILLERANAISQIISSTGIANAKAVAATPLTLGQPFVTINTASAVLSIGSIIAQAIRSLTDIGAAAGGGDFITKGPQLMLVGDNPGGRERVTVEPLSGRGKTVVGKNMIAMAGGGTLETRSSTEPINQAFAFRSAMNNQPQIVASWKEATELNTRIQFKEALVTV